MTPRPSDTVQGSRRVPARAPDARFARVARIAARCDASPRTVRLALGVGKR